MKTMKESIARLEFEPTINPSTANNLNHWAMKCFKGSKCDNMKTKRITKYEGKERSNSIRDPAKINRNKRQFL